MKIVPSGTTRSITNVVVAIVVGACLVLALPVSAAAETVWLPIAGVGHPIGLCRDAMNAIDVIDMARDFAVRSGFEPPPGAAEPPFRMLDRLSAGEADRKYEYGLTTDTPSLDPWECVWVVEFEGRRLDVGGRPPVRGPTPGGPTAEPVYWTWITLVIHDARQEVVGPIRLSRSIGPTDTPGPTQAHTPPPRPTLGTPTLMPTPVSTATPAK